MKHPIELRWSDAWLLLAIYYAKGSTSGCLSAIIAAADYINHAVINYEELASGMIRLEQAGLIKIEPDLSSVTCRKESLSMVESVAQHVKTAYDARKEVERIINAVPWEPREPIPNPANNLEYPGLTREMYRAAVDDYLKTMKTKRR